MGELKASSLVGSQRYSSLTRAATSTASLLLLGTLVACTSGSSLRTEDCFPRYFQCSVGTCIPDEDVCNGIYNCVEGDDEENCGGVTESIGECFPGYYQCETGVCIPGNLVCNGDMNCQTGDDEANCSDKSKQEGDCFPGFYQCDTGVCIPEYLVCKGEMNCQP